MPGAQSTKEEKRRRSLLAAGAARRSALGESPRPRLRWARGSSCPLPEVSALQACGGAAQPPPEQEARAESSWPPRWRRQRHREGLVGGFPMHPEAVDAGVLGVAPVSQDPQLHHLVYVAILGPWGEKAGVGVLRPEGRRPHLGPDAPSPGPL